MQVIDDLLIVVENVKNKSKNFIDVSVCRGKNDFEVYISQTDELKQEDSRAAYTNPNAAAVVYRKERSKWNEAPKVLYDSKKICMICKQIMYNGKPQIRVSEGLIMLL